MHTKLSHCPCVPNHISSFQDFLRVFFSISFSGKEHNWPPLILLEKTDFSPYLMFGREHSWPPSISEQAYLYEKITKIWIYRGNCDKNNKELNLKIILIVKSTGNRRSYCDF